MRIFLLTILSFVFPYQAFSDQVKMRAGYMGSRNIDILPKMAENGMNTAVVKFGELRWPMRPEEKKLILKWAEACKQYDIRFMPVLNLWGGDEKKWVQLRHHLYYDGIAYKQTPCPLDKEIYKLAVHNRLLEIAKLSQSMPIYGVVIDLEMYGANIVAYPDYCLCDYCFEKFLAGRTVSRPIGIGERQQYLIKTKQVDSYRNFTKDYIIGLAKQTRTDIEVIAPSLMIGAFHLDLDKTYNRGLLKGLSSGSEPVFAFTEMTYSTGHGSYIHETQKRFRDSGANARLVVGIWQDKFPPENLAEQYYYCAKDSSGYWIYTIESLSSYTKKTLPFDKKLYWQAILSADDELDKLTAEPGYKSSLKIRSFESPTRHIALDKITVEPVKYVKADVNINPTNKSVMLRRLNKLVFVAQQGDELNFEIDFDKKRGNDKYYAEVVLISQQGNVLAKDSAKLYSDAMLKATAPYSGTYAIIIETFGNAAKVVEFSHPYSVDAGQSANLLKPGDVLYLYKPAGSRMAKVEFAVDGIGESVTAAFKSLSGQVLGVYDIVAREMVTVPLGSNPEEEIIELEIKPRPNTYFEDVVIVVKSGLGKYISPFKYGIVKAVN